MSIPTQSPRRWLGDLPSFASFKLDQESNLFLEIHIKKDFHALQKLTNQIALETLHKITAYTLIGSALLGTMALMTASTFVIVRTLKKTAPVHLLLYAVMCKPLTPLIKYLLQQASLLYIITLSMLIDIAASSILRSLHHRTYITKVALIPVHYQKRQNLSEIASNILNLFLIDQVQASDLICPLSQKMMAFPMKSPCHHVFELFSLAAEIRTCNEGSLTKKYLCPTCTAPLSEMNHDLEKSDLIRKNGRHIFIKLEQLLIQPSVIKEMERQEISLMISRGSPILRRPLEELNQLIHRTPEKLLPDEIVALTAFIIKQFIPFEHNLYAIYQTAFHQLTEISRRRDLSLDTSSTLILQLIEWYDQKRCIPEPCKRVAELFHLIESHEACE
ncbi:MAG: hypothetical protein QRY71_00425 [Candidatus Rhabdochlamydia sp.]